MVESETGNIDRKTIDLGAVEIDVALNAGPRILGYRRPGGADLFASLPEAVIEHDAVGVFRLLGGHRLWRAPERPAITYAPDDNIAIQLLEQGDGFSLTGPAESDGLAKTIRVSQRGQNTVVDHELHNQGPSQIVAAAWSITQLSPGGRAFLPQSRSRVDDDGVLPNRHLVCWPYTDLSAPEFEFRADAVVIHGSQRPQHMKLGQPNHRGWIAYAKGTEVFVKWAKLHDDSEQHVDHGATVQCYRDERFVELETLGPLTTIEPGRKAMHREIWHIRDIHDMELDAVLSDLPQVPEVP